MFIALFVIGVDAFGIDHDLDGAECFRFFIIGDLAGRLAEHAQDLGESRVVNQKADRQMRRINDEFAWFGAGIRRRQRQ